MIALSGQTERLCGRLLARSKPWFGLRRASMDRPQPRHLLDIQTWQVEVPRDGLVVVPGSSGSRLCDSFPERHRTGHSRRRPRRPRLRLWGW